MDIKRLLLKYTGKNHMNQLFKDKTGFTLLEVIMSVFLLSVIFLAVSSLYVASQKFYMSSNQKVIVGYEVQYAIQHIYKNTMLAIGDETEAPDSSGIQLPSAERLDLRINTNDPITSANYNTVTTYSYYKSGNTLIFDNGVTQESLIPKVTVSALNFSKSGNTLIGFITAAYGAESATFYFSCYPRLATFN